MNAMERALIAWLGITDIKVSQGDTKMAPGPIARVVESQQFERLELLSNYTNADLKRGAREYVSWLKEQHPACKIRLHQAPLDDPTDHKAILGKATEFVDGLLAEDSPPHLTFHLNPGTPSMHAVWLLLAKAKYPAELIQSNEKAHIRADQVRKVTLPFDISVDFHPELLRKSDDDLTRLILSLPPDAPEFDDIIHRCRPMKEAVTHARQVAQRRVPVLILGESGTGKDLFARAIHEASGLKGDFIKVNCGAIPEGLAESELFGHKKGSFTGATGDRKGHFLAAHGGTLFLDEVGELSKELQVKLLRSLQAGEVTPLGESRSIQVDVRVIAATNRDLAKLVQDGAFREDLYFRLAVWVMKLPALRERGDDVGMLIDHFVKKLDSDLAGQPGFEPKKLSATARNILKAGLWPGNARELENALIRASLWAAGPTIGKREVERALDVATPFSAEVILGRPLGDGLNVQELMDEVARHYIVRALEEARGVKRQAAELLGLGSATTLTNWMDRLGF
jgi:transcriptional regulator with GAF, ATPase, and Fis domain